MKILFTGMGTHHCKKPENASFFSLLSDMVENFAQVEWLSPDVTWTKEHLDEYDAIIFGLLPPTALSANKLYGALNVLGLMFDSPKLKLVVDSPQVWQYKNSISAVAKDYGYLLNSAYNKKEGYQYAKNNEYIVSRACAHMLVSDWPEIIYPSLPWNSDNKIAQALRFVDSSNLIGINLDSRLILPEPMRIGREDYWSVENHKNSWIDYISKSMSFPVKATKPNKKTDDLYAMEIIENGIGLIVPPQERNMTTWWNYRLIQAMNSNTPVVTYWPDTKDFDPSWSALAYQVEDMTAAKRQSLASRQREVYLENIDREEFVVEKLQNILLDSKKERNYA